MSKFSFVANNLTAVNPRLANEETMRRKKQLCWKCQCDEPLFGGSLRFLGADRSTRIFVCKKCIDKRNANKADAIGEAMP